MTATTAKADDDRIDDLPVPPWVRPLSLDEQDALIREAEDEIDRGEGVPHEEAKALIAEMIAEAHRAAVLR